MDVSNLGSRRKIVHVWDVFGEKGDKEKTPKEKSVSTPKTELFPVKESGIYLADGVSHGVKSQKSPGRKKRPAPKPPRDPGLHEMDSSYDSGTGLKEISNLDKTFYENSKCNNLISKNLPEYDPVTGLRMSNLDDYENISSHGFMFGEDHYKGKVKEYPCDLNSPTESMDDPFGLTASNTSKVSTRASSGYYSDDTKDSLRRQLSKGSPSYPDIKEIEAESEMNNNEKEGKDDISFEEDEMTMSFDEEDEEVTGREKKLYEEYSGEDFSEYIQEDACQKRKKKKMKRKIKPKSKKAEGDEAGTGDPVGSVYKGTLLGVTRNFGNKNTLSSFDKLSNFSFADSKIGSIKPDNKSHSRDMQGHWWDVDKVYERRSNDGKDLVKKDKPKGLNTAVIPENEFYVYSYDQRANLGT